MNRKACALAAALGMALGSSAWAQSGREEIVRFDVRPADHTVMQVFQRWADIAQLPLKWTAPFDYPVTEYMHAQIAAALLDDALRQMVLTGLAGVPRPLQVSSAGGKLDVSAAATGATPVAATGGDATDGSASHEISATANLSIPEDSRANALAFPAGGGVAQQAVDKPIDSDAASVGRTGKQPVAPCEVVTGKPSGCSQRRRPVANEPG